MNAVISTDLNNVDKLKTDLSNFPSMEGLELASKVSTKKPYSLEILNLKLKLLHLI